MIASRRAAAPMLREVSRLLTSMISGTPSKMIVWHRRGQHPPHRRHDTRYRSRIVARCASSIVPIRCNEADRSRDLGARRCERRRPCRAGLEIDTDGCGGRYRRRHGRGRVPCRPGTGDGDERQGSAHAASPRRRRLAQRGAASDRRGARFSSVRPVAAKILADDRRAERLATPRATGQGTPAHSATETRKARPQATSSRM